MHRMNTLTCRVHVRVALACARFVTMPVDRSVA